MVSFAGKLDATSYIGTEVRRVRANPGPGTYKPDLTKVSRNGGCFTIRGRLHVNYDTKTPGPGSYNCKRSKIRSAPSWSFSNMP